MTFCFHRIGKFYHVNMRIEVIFMINFMNFLKFIENYCLLKLNML